MLSTRKDGLGSGMEWLVHFKLKRQPPIHGRDGISEHAEGGGRDAPFCGAEDGAAGGGGGGRVGFGVFLEGEVGSHCGGFWVVDNGVGAGGGRWEMTMVEEEERLGWVGRG